MTSYDEFLRTAAVPRETINRFLDEGEPTWARFDGEVGYTLGRYLPRDGVYDSWTVSATQDNGQRTSRMYENHPCRINTYGNSFRLATARPGRSTWLLTWENRCATSARAASAPTRPRTTKTAMYFTATSGATSKSIWTPVAS